MKQKNLCRHQGFAKFLRQIETLARAPARTKGIFLPLAPKTFLGSWPPPLQHTKTRARKMVIVKQVIMDLHLVFYVC